MLHVFFFPMRALLFFSPFSPVPNPVLTGATPPLPAQVAFAVGMTAAVEAQQCRQAGSHPLNWALVIRKHWVRQRSL